MDLICIFLVYNLYYAFCNVIAEPVVVPKQQTTAAEMTAPVSSKLPQRPTSPPHKPKPKIKRGCSMECMQKMKQDIEDDQEFSQFILKQSKPFRFQSQFDEVMLRKYCQKMNKTINCVSPCGRGVVKTIALQALSLPRYMCVETKFFDYAPCFKKVTKKMEKFCHSGTRCGVRKVELETLMNKQSSNSDEVNRLVQATCKYLLCFNDCDRNEVIRDCGKSASDVMDGLFAKSIEVMKSMFQTMRLPVDMPAECYAILNRRSTSASGETVNASGVITPMPNVV